MYMNLTSSGQYCSFGISLVPGGAVDSSAVQDYCYNGLAINACTLMPLSDSVDWERVIAAIEPKTVMPL